MLILRFLIPLILMLTISPLAEPILTVATDSIDFGRVPQNSYLYRKVIFRSEGTDPVRITRVDKFCECIQIPLDTNVIPPGDSLIVNVSLFTSTFGGRREWQPHIYATGKNQILRLPIKAFIIPEVEKQADIFVFPHTLNVSQYGDKAINKFPIRIINKTGENIPLKLIYNDDEFYALDFPVFIPPRDTAEGSIFLNDRGIASEFEKTIIFEYINPKNEKEKYSIPVKRKLFRSK